jgi:hypothetical protein
MKNMLPHALAALSLAATAQAASVPFNASYSGSSEVIEVVNADGPVLRFETVAVGSASFDLLNYFSTDVIDMSTGVGTGSNRFVAGNGDELYGSFSIQVIPSAQANIVGLSGLATFTGGTGMFSQASGSAVLSGSGVFTSATRAIATLEYSGSVAVVPEPSSAWLLLSGMAALMLPLRRRLCIQPRVRDLTTA